MGDMDIKLRYGNIPCYSWPGMIPALLRGCHIATIDCRDVLQTAPFAVVTVHGTAQAFFSDSFEGDSSPVNGCLRSNM